MKQKKFSLNFKLSLVTASLLFLMAVACNNQTDQTAMEDIAKQEISEFYGEWFGSMENEDIDGFLELLSNDFYLKSPAQPPTSDASELRSQLEQYHQTFTSSVDWDIEDIQLFDNHALVRVTESITLANRESGDTLEINGVHLAHLVKDDSGMWKMKTDISSLNHPVSP